MFCPGMFHVVIFSNQVNTCLIVPHNKSRSIESFDQVEILYKSSLISVLLHCLKVGNGFSMTCRSTHNGLPLWQPTNNPILREEDITSHWLAIEITHEIRVHNSKQTLWMIEWNICITLEVWVIESMVCFEIFQWVILSAFQVSKNPEAGCLMLFIWVGHVLTNCPDCISNVWPCQHHQINQCPNHSSKPFMKLFVYLLYGVWIWLHIYSCLSWCFLDIALVHFKSLENLLCVLWLTYIQVFVSFWVFFPRHLHP